MSLVRLPVVHLTEYWPAPLCHGLLFLHLLVFKYDFWLRMQLGSCRRHFIPIVFSHASVEASASQDTGQVWSGPTCVLKETSQTDMGQYPNMDKYKP